MVRIDLSKSLKREGENAYTIRDSLDYTCFGTIGVYCGVHSAGTYPKPRIKRNTKRITKAIHKG